MPLEIAQQPLSVVGRQVPRPPLAQAAREIKEGAGHVQQKKTLARLCLGG